MDCSINILTDICNFSCDGFSNHRAISMSQMVFIGLQNTNQPVCKTENNMFNIDYRSSICKCKTIVALLYKPTHRNIQAIKVPSLLNAPTLRLNFANRFRYTIVCSPRRDHTELIFSRSRSSVIGRRVTPSRL